MGPSLMLHCMRKMTEMPEEVDSHWLHFHDLDLNDKQLKELRNIESTTLKDLIRKKADKRIFEIELHELLDNEIVDTKAVKEKFRQIALIESEMQLTVIESMERMKAVLTPAQLNTLKKLRQMNHE